MLYWKKERLRQRLGVVLILVIGFQVLVNDVGRNTVVKAQSTQNMTEWETPSGITSDQIDKELDTIFNSYIGKTVQGAAIAIAKDGKIVYEKGYGYADRENNILVDPATTVFEYGSVTKLFTWVSAMQLAEEGKLDLEKDIRSYLPSNNQLELPFRKPVTMLNLMNHTAGLDDYLIGVFARKDNCIDLENGLKEQAPQQLYKPGEIFSYSNYGVALAGYIVQNVANQEEYEYVQDHIFDPLGMKKVTMSVSKTECEELLKNKSKGYIANGYNEKTKDWSFDEGKWTYVSIYPAGEGNGTVEELANFGIGLLDKKSGLFKSEKTYEELLSTTYTSNKDISGIAHGFFEYDGENKTYWHKGETNNFTTFFAVVPEADFAIAIVANTQADEEKDLVQEVGFRCVGKKQVNLERVAGEKLPNSREVAGTYTVPRRCHRGISQLIYLTTMYDVLVKYVDDSTIEIDGDYYRQIKPYLYQNQSTGQKCYFTAKDGKVIKYTYIRDYMKDNIGIKVRYITSYIIIGTWCLSVVGMLVFLLVALMKRNAGKFKSQYVMEGLWIGLGINIVLLLIRALDGARFQELQPQIIVNVIIGLLLACLSIETLIKTVIHKKVDTSRFRNIWLTMYSVVTILMLIVLWNWGVFYIFS